MKYYKARGIVLHTIKYGESSSVVYMLTDTNGRQTYMVNGVRSSGKSRGGKMSLLQPMMPVELVGMESAKMQMHRIKEIKSGAECYSIPFDIRKSTIALFMAEVIYKVIREVEPNSPVFEFVWNSISALDSLSDGISNFHLWFLVNLSYHLGFFPGNEYEQGMHFDIQEGLFTFLPVSHGIAMSKQSSHLLSDMMNAQVLQLADIKLSGALRSEFMNDLLNYFSYHLDTINNVKSIQILRDVF